MRHYVRQTTPENRRKGLFCLKSLLPEVQRAYLVEFYYGLAKFIDCRRVSVKNCMHLCWQE